MMEEELDDVDIREQVFHNYVRECIIWLLLFVTLYVSSYATICAFRRRKEQEDCLSVDTDDAFVYRVSLWICTFTLAVSGGAVLLLPISIIANELLTMYPKTYYLKWVNSSLIHGLWSLIFLASNLCLFILMPFAYLFTESEGFPGSKKGIMPRVYETAVVLFLITVTVCGLAWVFSAIFDADASSRQVFFGKVQPLGLISNVWSHHLPYIYSCISLLGVVMLLICTPVGFGRLFTVMGELVVKPKFLRDLDEELNTVRFEEETLRRRIHHANGRTLLSNGHSSLRELRDKLGEVQHDRQALEKRRQVSSLRRNLGYPVVMLLLLALTTICVLMVIQNSIGLLIGLKALPKGAKEIVLGISSLSTLGPIGAVVEVILIFYLMSASVVGFFSLPFFHRLMPVLHDTPMTTIIGIGAVILIMSSALPVLSRTLGITNFDLIGNFGSMEWLGNFYIILFYNLVFAVATALCLVKKFTATIRNEIYNRFETFFRRERQNTSNVSANGSSLHIKDE